MRHGDSAVAQWKSVLISNQTVLGMTPEEHSDFILLIMPVSLTASNTSFLDFLVLNGC